MLSGECEYAAAQYPSSNVVGRDRASASGVEARSTSASMRHAI
jgi:hypothetical protein